MAFDRVKAKFTRHDHEQPAGVQGPNFGYWQTTGATRAAAKRAKRP